MNAPFQDRVRRTGEGTSLGDPTTRDVLIDAGLHHMQKASFCATGLNEVLAQAGLSKGSFYHYFPSKEDYGRAVLQRYLELESVRMDRLLEEAKTAPIKKLRKHYEELISVYGPKGTMNGGCLLGNLSQEMANQSDLVQQALQEGFRAWQAVIDIVLREAVSRSELPPEAETMELASFILNSYQGALLRAKAERSETPLRLFLRIIFDTLLIAG